MKCPNVSASGKKTLLETYLDITFFFCISPFRILWDGSENSSNETSTIFQCKPQKLLAGLFALLDIYGSINLIRINVDKNLDNPVGYFNFMWSIAVTLMHVSFYFVLWTRQHHCLKAVEIFRKSFSNSCNMTKWPCNPVIGCILCILSLVLGILPSLKGSHLLASSTAKWSPCLVFRAHVDHAKFMFYLSDNSFSVQNSSYYMTPGESSCSLDNLETIEIVQGFGHIVVYTVRYMGAYFEDLFMIISSVTLWLGVNEFVKESTADDIPVIQPSETSLTIISTPGGTIGSEGIPGSRGVIGDQNDELRNSERMVSKYGDLKCLANAINGVMSPILFCYVFEAIFYYAINLNSIFTAHDYHARIQVAHFLLGCFSVLGFSADVARKMDGFKLWLVNGNTLRKSIGSDLMVCLIHETQSKTIGVSALGIFTVDYPLIFNIVTTTVTFFLIVVQFVPNTC